MRILFTTLLTALIFAAPRYDLHAAHHEEAQKAVLVTGATSGIGLRIAEELASQGHFVYAGARKDADIKRLNAMENIEAVKLDVTVQADIDAAVQQIAAGDKGLHAIVNNAGVFIGGPVTDVSIEETEWLFDVNVFGVYRVTQAFAPMIIESKGRIVNISSISGIGSGIFFSQYSMSKHAVEAFTDSLASEMARYDVEVSAIEPGNYDSKIVATAYERMLEKGYIKKESPYYDDLIKFMEWPADRSIYKPPDEVAEAVMHALFDPAPLRRYMVVPDIGEARWSIGTVIKELIQYNTWQAYSFSRDELVQMLDEALKPAEE